MFTFGVGSDCDKHLVGEVAKAGRGTASYVVDYEELNACVIEALSRASEPSLKDCKIEWSNNSILMLNSTIVLGELFRNQLVNHF